MNAYFLRLGLLTTSVTITLANPALANRHTGRGVSRALVRVPELIVPYLMLSGIMFLLTKDVAASLESAFGLMIIGLIFAACMGL